MLSKITLKSGELKVICKSIKGKVDLYQLIGQIECTLNFLDRYAGPYTRKLFTAKNGKVIIRFDQNEMPYDITFPNNNKIYKYTGQRLFLGTLMAIGEHLGNTPFCDSWYVIKNVNGPADHVATVNTDSYCCGCRCYLIADDHTDADIEENIEYLITKKH